MKELVEFLTNISDFGLIVIIVGILLVLYVLPNTIRRLGVVRLGPLEMEHRHQSQNYEVNRKVDEIDIANRERLWEMTEDIFDIAASSSKIRCEAVVGYILDGIAGPIRNLVMINHISSKLLIAEEDNLRSRIGRGVARAMRDTKKINYGNGCPIQDDIRSLELDGYTYLIDDWIARARSITAKSCRDKIRVYETALEDTKDRHWIRVYQNCIVKNQGYIRGMGYNV